MVFNWGKKMVARHDDEEDMTMEEILASIRRYVADDKPTSSERPKVSEFKAIQETETVTNTIIVEPNSEKVEMPQKEAQSREEKIFELTEVVEEEVIVTPQETIVIQETIQTPIPAPAPVPRPQPIQEVRKPHIPSGGAQTSYTSNTTHSKGT
jgi:hypothetical protein